MTIQFKLGAFAGSLLLIQLEFAFCIIVLLFFGIISEYSAMSIFEYIGNILAIALFAILTLGHIKTSVAMWRDFTDPTVAVKPMDTPKTITEAFDIFKNPVTLGLVWRFQYEAKFIKEIANLNFRYKE